MDNTKTVYVDKLELSENNNLVNEKHGYDSDSESSISNHSNVSSVKTQEILNIDPLYIRLSKFLNTTDGTNVATLISEMNNNIKQLNTNIEKLLIANSS